jgi:hypothetical protein
MYPSSFIPDPLDMWRKAIAELEARGNALSSRAMSTAEAATALHQIVKLSLGMQATFEKVLGMYLKQLNLPSRREVVQLAETLQRLEDKLDQLLAAQDGHGADTRTRPARTRKPPASGEPAQSPEPRKRRGRAPRAGT